MLLDLRGVKKSTKIEDGRRGGSCSMIDDVEGVRSGNEALEGALS